MEEKKAVVSTVPPTGKPVMKSKKREFRPYMFLIPIAIVLIVVLGLSWPFSQLATVIVVCVTALIFGAMLGRFIKSLLGGDTPPPSPQERRSEWMISQSLRVAEALKTRHIETTRPDGTVTRSTEGLPDADRQKLLSIIEKALKDADAEELPLPPKERELDELELDNGPFEDDWPFN